MNERVRSTILQLIPAPTGYRMLKIARGERLGPIECPVIAWALVECTYTDEGAIEDDIPDVERTFRAVVPMYVSPQDHSELQFKAPGDSDDRCVGMMFPDEELTDWSAAIVRCRKAIELIAHERAVSPAATP